MDPGKNSKKKNRPVSVRIKNKTKKITLMHSSKLTGRVSMRGLKKQEELIHGGDWDNLIILDACRYDYFEQEYPNFLEGKLSKLRSPASWTYAWLSKMFGGKYDIKFYSAHPGVNSRGVGRNMGYVGADHFKDIVDVWDFGWDGELGTVHPKTLTDVVLKDLKSGKTGEKNIIWYVQPHAPWIGKTKLAGFRKDWNDKTTLDDISEKISNGEISLSEFRQAYRDNLRLALECVADLVPHLKGKTVVSADHGELLGEWGYCTHPSFFIHKDLRTVPWLEVSRSKVKKEKLEKTPENKKTEPEKSDEEKIKERLMNLGYM
jgi:hypothetical protein